MRSEHDRLVRDGKPGITTVGVLGSDLYDKLLHEADPAKQRVVMSEFEKYVLDTEAHEIVTPWWYRIIPYQSYVKGWKISPSHFVNQDLATIWLDK